MLGGAYGGQNGDALHGVGAALHGGVRGVVALVGGDGAVGSDEDAQAVGALQNLTDDHLVVVGNAGNGSGTHGAHVPQVGGQGLVHRRAGGEHGHIHLEAVLFTQVVLLDVVGGQAGDKGHGGHTQGGELPGVGLAVGLGVGAGVASAGSQGQGQNQSQNQGQILFHFVSS